ncbi:hypothetical protein [Alicyclobacillus dauci]|uniref:Uncharacterized protein n=1 Tax=Alicyclobacillus dauci TaxID=1475485 RepID=A0ABY6Z749_9BACL|nr:hypothetical protein [Alicyclobacillus dauci]WAH38575.1 hypothetical protein NZD86_08885 [Alicyclobacillus dauci]
MLDNNKFFRIKDRAALRIYTGPDAYIKYYEQFAHCELRNCKIYSAQLKSSIAMWNSWIASMNAFKVALATGLLASALTSLVSFLYAHFNLLYTPWWVDGIIITFLLVIFIVNIPALLVSVKIEKATFLLSIIDDVVKLNQETNRDT